MLDEIDQRGIIATPANSFINELVTEAARLSINQGGRQAVIDYRSTPAVRLRDLKSPLRTWDKQPPHMVAFRSAKGRFRGAKADFRSPKMFASRIAACGKHSGRRSVSPSMNR